MRRRYYLKGVAALIALAAIALLLLAAPGSRAASPVAPGSPGLGLPPSVSTGAQADTVPVVNRGVLPVAHFDVSPPLSSMKPVAPGQGNIRENEDRDNLQAVGSTINPDQGDPVVQKLLGRVTIPTPIISFDGPPNLCNCSPPDPNGEVGPNHYVVMSNLSFQIYNKSGVSLYGPAANNTLWAGFGGACQTENAGDPIVLYDQFADRWLLSQFTAAGPTYYNCVALSTTGDPTGSYYRWAFTTGANFPDYPKYGVWPDAYYISTREFAGSSFAGVGAYAGNRAQMIAGNPNPQVISFLAPPSPLYNIGDGLLPADVDGSTLPPAGRPEYFVGSMDNGAGYGAPQDALTLWKFTANFPNPPASSFVLANTLPIAAFDTVFPCTPTSRNCISQPGTTNKLDILSYRQRPLFRLAYRNMGSYETLLTNQAVEAGTGPNGAVAGIRWWEVRSPNTSPVIYQEGTYAPGLTDGIHRWMGAMAMDQAGNIALGYSASSSTTYPSIFYTGRLAGDPLGQMTLGEASIMNGTGSQTSSQRWGDYTDMTVDPVDDCTFWYVNQYLPTTSGAGWRERIGAFRLPNCPAAQVTVTATPSVTRTPTRTPTQGTITPTPCATQFTGSITSGDPTMAGRMFRDGIPSTCAAPKTCPGPFDATPHHYDSYTFTNTQSTTVCITVDIDPMTCTGTNYIFSSAYLGSFNPADMCQNYLADAGSSPDPSGTTSYSFNVPAGATFVVVVNEVNAAAGCAQYTLNIGGLVCATPTTTPTVTPTQCVMNFSDVQPGAYYYEDVRCVYCMGAVSGYADGTFRPFNNTTRGQMTKIIVVALDIPIVTPTGAPTFNDVPTTNPFYAYIETAAANAIVSGYNCGGPGEPCPGTYFRPFADVTRGQLSKIVVVAANQVFGWPILNPPTATFSDVPPGSAFYVYIETAVCHGVVSGYADGTFRPFNNAIRAQIAKIVCRTSQNPASTCAARK